MSQHVSPHAVGSPQASGPSRVLLPTALALTGVLLGLATGVAPLLVGTGLLAAGVTLLMLLRLDVAVLVFVVASLFEGYLAQLDPLATKLLSAVVVASWVLMRSRAESVGMHRVPVVLVGVVLWWVLLVSTLFRLGLNLASTRLVLTSGHEGGDAAGGRHPEQLLGGGQPRVRRVVVGPHVAAEDDQRVVLGQVVGQRVTGVRAPDVEAAAVVGPPPAEQPRRALVLVLDDEQRDHATDELLAPRLR